MSINCSNHWNKSWNLKSPLCHDLGFSAQFAISPIHHDCGRLVKNWLALFPKLFHYEWDMVTTYIFGLVWYPHPITLLVGLPLPQPGTQLHCPTSFCFRMEYRKCKIVKQILFVMIEILGVIVLNSLSSGENGKWHCSIIFSIAA